jgi:hypothetical protein
MASEIRKTTKLTWSKGGAQIILDVTETTDQTGDAAIGNVQSIGAASEAISLVDVTLPGNVGFKNLNREWSALSTAEKTAAVSKAAYDIENTVHVGATSPVTALNAQFSFVPGAGSAFPTVITAWYGIRGAGTNVNLYVVAIEA